MSGRAAIRSVVIAAVTRPSEQTMAIAMMVDNPHGSSETYYQLVERLGLETPAGGELHLAGPSPNGGWRVIEVFPSEDDAKRFIQERLVPAFQALGAPPPPPPEFWPVERQLT